MARPTRERPVPRKRRPLGYRFASYERCETKPTPSENQISPTAVESLACLQRLRFGYDCWNALGRPDRVPQPRDFGLALPPLPPHEVWWRGNIT